MVNDNIVKGKKRSSISTVRYNNLSKRLLTACFNVVISYRTHPRDQISLEHWLEGEACFTENNQNKNPSILHAQTEISGGKYIPGVDSGFRRRGDLGYINFVPNYCTFT